MRKLTFTLLATLFLLCFSRGVCAQDFVTGGLTAQAAACPTNPGNSSSSTSALTLAISNFGGATFTIGSTTFSGTLSFFASGDGGTTWQALNVTPTGSTTLVTTATATGLWQVNVSGFTHVCAVVTTFVSGTVTVTIRKSIAAARGGSGGGSGLPAGCVGAANPLISCTQAANGNDTITVVRNTDTSPTGTAYNFLNAAKNATLFSVDVLGNETAQSFQATGAGAGYFQCSNGNGTLPTLVSGQLQITCPSGVITNYQLVLPTAAGTGPLCGTNASNVVTIAFGGCGGGSWSSLTNPSGNMLLNTMGTNLSEWDYATPLSNAWKIANITAATSSVNQSSPVLSLFCGRGWEGASPADSSDCFSIQNSIPNGANPQSILLITNSSSSTNGSYVTFASMPVLDTGSGFLAGASVTNFASSMSQNGVFIGSNGVFSMYNNPNINSGSLDTGLSRLGAGIVGVGNGTQGNVTGTIEPGKYATGTNCSSSASPAVCGSAAAGSVVIAAAATSVVVDTTAVTANSQIFIQPDDSLGTKLSVTCNTTGTLLDAEPWVSARSGGTSFTITVNAAPSTNPECLSYFIVN